MLSGTIPHTLANATKLADLYLDGNYLTGGVPKPLCKDNLNADFFQNLPASDTKQRDLCDSVTCPANTVSLEGVYPCTPCPSTIPHPYMGNTQTCQDLTQDKIIAALFGLNPDSSSKSACKYKGVECDDNGYVVKIYAAGKALSGTLPEQIGFLDHLRELDISNNHFNGFLPSSLRFPPIQVLKLGGNQFSGIITPLLCLKQNINGNGQNGPLTCNSIACPIGTYSVNAYGYGECLNCPDGAPFIGSTLCSPNAIPPRHRSSDNGVHGTSVAIVVLSVVATVSIIVVYLRHRQQQFLATHEYSDGKVFQPSGGESSLPHPDEAKSTFQRYREHIQERRRSSGGNWIQKRLKKSYHYVISLTETENVPGKRYVGGQIDDFGWKERESILHHRDLENCVKAQQQNGIKTSVWEYPDPLESVSSYKTDSFEEEEEDGDDDDYDDTLGDDDDDDDDDLHEWIKKQQSDPATRDVWLDVPRVE